MLAEGRGAKLSSSRYALSLGAPAARGGSQSVGILLGHLGLDAFVQAGHSMPKGYLVGGMILPGVFVPPVPPVKGSEDSKLRSLLAMQRVKPSLAQPPECWKLLGLSRGGSLSTFLGFSAL